MNQNQPIKKPEGFLSKMPSIVWVIVIPLILFGFIAAMIGGFWAMATVEGVASVLLLLAAITVIGFGNQFEAKSGKTNTIIRAVGITFFAIMGMSVDQTGNFLYNQPIGWVVCPAQTSLERHVDISNPLPGTTYIMQDYRCVNADGDKVKEIDMPQIIIGRFFEYVLLGYALIYLNKLIQYTKAKKQNNSVGQDGANLS